MKPIILFAILGILVAHCYAKESSSSNLKPSRSGSGNKLDQPPLVLDPNLRRALLKALEELELEAQDRVAEKGPNDSRTSKTSQSARALEQVLNEFQKNAQESLPLNKPRDIEPSLIKKVQEFVVLNQPGFVAVEEVPADSKRVRVSTEEKIQVQEKSTTEKQENVNTEQLKSETLAEKQGQGQVLYFQNSEPIVVAAEDSLKKELETRSAVLDDNVKDVVTPPGVIDIEPNLIPEVEKSDKSVNDSGDVTEKKEKTVEDHEVKIFQAPLVAAFTLHQDAQGLPQSVVPLYRPETPKIPIPTQNTFRGANSEQFKALTREQELEQKTRELEQQLLSLQRQQFQQQRLQYQEQQDQLQRQQQLLLDEQLRQRRYQEEQHRQQQIFQQQQQFTTSSRLRSQRQEQGTGNFGIVDFQPSISFQYPGQQQQQQRQQQQQQQQQRQQTSNSQSTDFIQQQQLPNIQSANYYQQQLPKVQPANFFNNQQQQQQQQQQTAQNDDRSHFFNNQQQQQQQQQQQRNNFNNNNNFQIQQSQQLPIQQNDFRASPVHSNFLFNSQNQVPLRRPQPQSADSQIQGLLFRSGIAGGAQEDLNIVSKVLSLNHEGTKSNDISSGGGRNQRNTAEGNFGTFRQPERYISPPLH